MSDELLRLERDLEEAKMEKKALNAVLMGKPCPSEDLQGHYDLYSKFFPDHPAKARDDIQATIAALEEQTIFAVSKRHEQRPTTSGRSASCRLTTAQKEHISKRVVSLEITSPTKNWGCGCLVPYPGHDGAIVACAHVLGACDGGEVAVEATVHFGPGVSCHLAGKFCGESGSDLIFLTIRDKHQLPCVLELFKHVSLPMHTQPIHHAGRTESACLQLSEGIVNYESATSVVSSAFAMEGWSGAAVFHFDHNDEEATLVGLVQGCENNDQGCRLHNKIIVQLLPLPFLTNKNQPKLFGLWVPPPFEDATLAYAKVLDENTAVLKNAQIGVASASESNAPSATTTSTNDTLPPFDDTAGLEDDEASHEKLDPQQ